IYFSSVPAETVGRTVTVGLRAFDTAGRSTLAQRAYTVDPDIHAPVISLASPGAGTQVTSGDRVRIVGSASDDVGVVSVTTELGGRALTHTNTSFDYEELAPPVAAPTIVPVTVVARDASGNESRVVRNIRVLPRADAEPPLLSLLCPGEAAMAV